jgi:hypothetical protein
MDIFLRRQEHRSGQGKPREGGNNQIKQSMPLSSPSVWRADQPRQADASEGHSLTRLAMLDRLVARIPERCRYSL